MTSWKAIGQALLLLTIASLSLAAEAPTLDQVVAQLKGDAPMSKRTRSQLPATCHTVLGLLLPRLGGDDLVARQDAREAWKAICWHATRPGAEAERAAAEAAMLARLAADLPRPAHLFLLRQLETVGRDAAVEPLATLMARTDPLLRDRARCALVTNSSPKASNALRRALARARSPEWQVGLINALGARTDRDAVPALIRLAAARDQAVRLAACDALARIGDGCAANAIAKATHLECSDRTWHALCRAYLLLADKLCQQGKQPAARAMYTKFLKSYGHLKCAALLGLGRAGGSDALPALLDALTDPEPEIRGAADAALDLLPVVHVRAAVAEKAKAASPEVKVLLLGVLARRGGHGVLPTLVAAAADPSEQVRLAAVEAMGTLADDQAAPTLIEALAKARGRELEAVKAAIARLQGRRTDRAIVQAIGDATPPVRVQLIQLLADRRAAVAAPALLEAARHADPAVRAAAFDALALVGDAQALAPLVALLADARDKRGRADAEKALVGVAARIADEAQRARPIAQALAASRDVDTRCALVRALGRIGGATALQAIRDEHKRPEPKVQDAAVRALADWQGVAVAADLLRIATTGTTMVHHVLALQGYLRLVGQPGDRPTAQTLKMYADGLAVARRDEERRLALAGIAAVPDPEALKIVEPLLDKPTLRNEAAMAMIGVAKAISGTHRDAATAALHKARDAASDPSTRKLAAQALDQMNRFADFLTAWLVAGPYTKAGRQGPALHNEAFAPENNGGNDAKWQPMPPGGDNPPLPFLMDLYKRFAKENCVAYLRTRVWSPAEQKVRLEFGSDDGAKVWLNGKLVLEVREPRSFEEAENKLEVTLRQGWNPMLVKVWNGGLYWSIAARLRAPDGSKLEGLRAAPDAP